MMRLQIQQSDASRNRYTFPIRHTPEKPKDKRPIFWTIIVILFTCIAFSQKPFLERGGDGEIQLAKWRKDKLNKELNDLEEAEQYVLLAKRNGTFECFSCLNKTTIDLKAGQVWRYGFTTKNEKGRYQKSLESKNLRYLVEYEGMIGECLQEEKRKIYFYALLPENLAREIPLIRPPGNKQDN